MHVLYAPSFLRELKHLSPQIQERVYAAIDAFKNPDNHEHLKVHKLKGKLAGQYAFTVTFRHRIIFEYISSNTAWLLDVGDHGIYQ